MLFCNRCNGEHLFIPKLTQFETIVTIAGDKTNTPIRVVNTLVKSYGGTSADWNKCAGKITSSKYVFDLHWYEKDGVQYDMKLKYVGISFGIDSLTDGKIYDAVEENGMYRVIDDSGEDYLYSKDNPAPLDRSCIGGKWEIIEE